MNQTIRRALSSRYLLIPVAALVFYGLAGFLAVPEILRRYLPRYADQRLGCEAVVEEIRINPFLLTLEMHRFSLREADGSPLLGGDRLFVDIGVRSVLDAALVVSQVEVEGPDIHLGIEPDGSLNLARLASQSAGTAAEDGSGLLPFDLRKLSVSGGRLSLVDHRGKQAAAVTIGRINLVVSDLATAAGRRGTFRLDAVGEKGETINWRGEVSLAPIFSDGSFTVSSAQVSTLWEFFRDSVGMARPAGRFDLSAGYLLESADGTPQLTFSAARLAVWELALQLPSVEREGLRVGKFSVEAPSFSLADRQLHIGKMLLEEGGVEIRIDEAGNIGLQRLFAGQAGVAGGGKIQQQTEKKEKTADPPFRIAADAVEVRNMSVGFSDRRRSDPVVATIAGLDLGMQATMDVGGDETGMTVERLSGRMRGVTLAGDRSPEPLLALEELEVDGGRCDLQARSAIVERVAANGARVDIVRDTAGKVDWLQLLQSGTAGAGIEGGRRSTGQDDESPWSFLVKAASVEGGHLRFRDLTTSSRQPVVSLQDIEVRLVGLGGSEPIGFNAGFRLEDGGKAKLDGTLSPQGPTLAAAVEIRDMTLTALQRYLEPHVTLEMQSASGSASGRLRYGQPGDEEAAVYEGSLSLDRLRLADPVTKELYLEADVIAAPTVRITLQPARFEAGRIIVTKPAGAVVIGKDGTVNLARIFRDSADGTEARKTEELNTAATPSPDGDDGFSYRLSRIEVEDGRLLFADMSLPTQFRTRIHDLRGSVTGLSSAPGDQARIRLAGQVDQYGLARIDGVVRPDDFRQYSDASIIFRNLEMKSLSPYVGKFAGRLITSGKVSADLKYQLQDGKMIGDNRLIIDNLVLGERVEHHEAAGLPLDLALALLRDGDGRIEIGLPVTGDLADPKFDAGALTRKLIVNLITKTATAPFQVLAAAFGHTSQNLHRLEFEPGSATLLPPEQEKLLQLADVLKGRPQLRLIVQGRYSQKQDGLARRRAALLGRIAGLRDGREPPDPLSETFSPDDSSWLGILEELYRQRFGEDSLAEVENSFDGKTEGRQKGNGEPYAAADEAGGELKRQKRWARELFGRRAEGEQLEEDALQKLARSRAQAVITFLESEGRVAGERLAGTEPEPLAAKDGPAVTLSLEAI